MRKAHELSKGRSELFTRATERNLDEIDDARLTGLVNDLVAHGQDAQEPNLAAAEADRARLPHDEDDW